jgi:hypothetical protein
MRAVYILPMWLSYVSKQICGAGRGKDGDV